MREDAIMDRREVSRHMISRAVPERVAEVRGGFSLIELLVVIAIIAVLAALLLPVFSRAKMSARSTQCKNNLRQLGIALEMYTGDMREFPLTTDYSTSNTWFSILVGDYAPNYDVMECPTFKGEYPAEDAIVFLSGGLSGYRTPSTDGRVAGLAYGYNGYGIGFADKAQKANAEMLGLGWAFNIGNLKMLAIKPTQVVSPSDMVAIADSMPQTGYEQVYAHLLSINTKQMPDPNRHGGKDNIAYVDGHVSSLTHHEFIDDTIANRLRWNIDNKPHLEIPLNPAP
jgi:prepilin-type N-terminal cleavage/methylation domain-containing protein/prepilin-type processing-associated H-X9-DG protein